MGGFLHQHCPADTLSYSCNFTFSSGHMSTTQTGGIHFNNICYLTPSVRNTVISAWDRRRVSLLRCSPCLCHAKPVKSGVCCYMYSKRISLQPHCRCSALRGDGATDLAIAALSSASVRHGQDKAAGTSPVGSGAPWLESDLRPLCCCPMGASSSYMELEQSSPDSC